MTESIYEKTLKELAAGKIESPRLEARLLIADILNVNPNSISAQIMISNEDEKKLRMNLEKRLKGMPLDKILGHKAFYKYDFEVSEDVLSPRPDTEVLVEAAVQIAKTQNIKNLLDLGVGSGCILLSILKENDQLSGTGVDVSQKALHTAQKNASNLALKDRCSFLCKDWNASDFGKCFDQGFDMIVSNPPYIKTSEIEKLETEVKDYDPMIALDGGEDGLNGYRQIAFFAPKLLNQNGYILLEVGAGQAAAVRHIFEEKGLSYLETLSDLSGIERVIILKK